MPTTVPRIQFTNVSKRFPGVQALDRVSFDVQPDHIHAVVGENGAGKSTLMKILAGAHQPNEGAIRIDGQPATITNPRHAQQLGIATVYQELNLIPDLTVAENVFIGRWPHNRPTGLIDFASIARQTEQLFARLNISIPANAKVHNLTIAQQQMVEIAKALSLNARILTLDEPSAVLTPHELESLFNVVRRLAEQNVTTLYISHRLEEIFELAHTVTVLRDGQHIATRPIADVTRHQLIHDMVGRPVEQEFPPRSVDIGPRVLHVENLSAERSFRNISFDIHAGEIFALTGLVGSGRSSVAKTIFGHIRATTGSLEIAETKGPFKSARHAMSAGIALLPEDRKREGLLLERPLRENLTLADPSVAATAGLLNLRTERTITADLMTTHNVKGTSTEIPARTLSGGNQQKVLLARWLQRNCRLLILDEPTRGVDIGAKVEIYNKLNTLASQGLAILIISSELPEVIGMADRIGVMCEGKLTGILDNASRDTSQEAIMQLAVKTD